MTLRTLRTTMSTSSSFKAWNLATCRLWSITLRLVITHSKSEIRSTPNTMPRLRAAMTNSERICSNTWLTISWLKSTRSGTRRSNSIVSCNLWSTMTSRTPIRAYLTSQRLTRAWSQHTPRARITSAATRSMQIMMTLASRQSSLWMPRFSSTSLALTAVERLGPNGCFQVPGIPTIVCAELTWDSLPEKWD